MRIVLISDTHIPKRAKDLPPRVWEAIDAADVVFHAGDWVDPAVLDALEARARRLVGVVGNNDGPRLGKRLPELAQVELQGLRFTVVHDTGPREGREKRCDAWYPGTDVLVFGHSHIPWDTTTPKGMRLLNPGSPTDRRRQPFATFMTAAIVDGKLSDVTVLKAVP
ncbi:MAG TPA: metallophosphoesterase [Candidatus Limnocylindrales bacterium]|nr:metallophosphoesterase [Candidatus Limnocylindrales bacterium]